MAVKEDLLMSTSPQTAAVTVSEPESEAQIVIQSLGKTYQSGKKTTFEALRSINLAIGKNEFLTLLGPSGCGKSTLLRILAGLEDASEGELLLDGAPIVGPGAERGMVFQGYTLFPWLTVRENIEYGPKLSGIPILERRRISNYYLRMIRLEQFANSYPKQLSGGMKQRVAIARALANRPKVLLMDEPFGALDAQTKLEMQELLLEVWEKEKTTVVFITHDIEEAVFLSQRICVMGAGPGRIVSEHLVQLPGERSELTRQLPEFLQLKRELAAYLKH